MGEINIRQIRITENSKDIVLIAQQINEIIGYIHGRPYGSFYTDSLINILGFVVKEEYTNIGVGKALIKKLECLAKENGYCGVRLASEFRRPNGHRFYQIYRYINNKKEKNFIMLFD